MATTMTAEVTFEEIREAARFRRDLGDGFCLMIYDGVVFMFLNQEYLWSRADLFRPERATNAVRDGNRVRLFVQNGSDDREILDAPITTGYNLH